MSAIRLSLQALLLQKPETSGSDPKRRWQFLPFASVVEGKAEAPCCGC
ncbi:MAG: hypothetical protein ACI9XZ_004628 [Alphaproteobacteria bacterium]